MNEDGSAMIHEARRRGLLRVTVLANTFCEAVGCTHWAFIIKYWYLEASKVAPHAVNETFIQFRHNIIRPHGFWAGILLRCPLALRGEHAAHVG